MDFPTKNDHLGCEMRVPPFKETPIDIPYTRDPETTVTARQRTLLQMDGRLEDDKLRFLFGAVGMA